MSKRYSGKSFKDASVMKKAKLSLKEKRKLKKEKKNKKNQMQYWLMKSEPDVWSIDQQIKAGEKGADWDGVRNYQAANNLKKMQKGDLCFFYHSNIGKEVVGIVEVIKTAFVDPTDKKKRFVAVKVKFKNKLQNPVTLENIKKIKDLKSLSLIKQTRLSVMPIDTKSWKIILNMGRIK